jgi:transketolase
MGLKTILERFRNKKEKYKEYAEDMNIQKKYEERLKSSNERELERFMKEEREDSIKKELEEFRNNNLKKAQYGNQITQVKNMFANDKQRILGGKSILKNDDRLLNGGNMFFNG